MKDILVVEDGRQERERLTKLFQNAGYSVQACESVGDAEKTLQTEAFRLAILDIGLSDKSGSYLFDLLKKSKHVPYVIILTGNPSVHLKTRFLDEGAVAYLVKASPLAENEPLLDRVRGLLGGSDVNAVSGFPLGDFAKLYLNLASRELFLEENGDAPACTQCGGREYVVSFGHKTQLPPVIEGQVICGACGREMDPEVG